LEQIYKIFLSTDYFLKFGNMKEKSSVIVDQHATVNMFFSLVQTACHVLEMSLLKVGVFTLLII